jgi:2-polyprenyl-3-methyl-5-hydroxy-6-metoxy-1,4-benzoquinol methylase
MTHTKKIKILKKIIKKEQVNLENTQRYAYLNTKKYAYEKILDYFIGKNVLELGSDGTATSSVLVRCSKKLTIVDMQDKFSTQLKKDKKLKNAKFILSQWESFKPKKKYSDIFLTDSLEHVQNPVNLLKLIRSWLSKEGRLHIIVPNALSLHRLLGVELGFLKSPYELNKNDIESGHVKVYDHNILKEEIKQAGLSILSCQGVQLKLNTDVQLANLPQSFSDATNKLSYLFNENCAEIYICCTK